MAGATPHATELVAGKMANLAKAEREFLLKLMSGISERAEKIHHHLSKG